MPTYVYKCPKCGTIEEIFHGISETNSSKCRKCNSKINKVFTPVGIVFKGSGFYKTDSRKISPCTAESEAPKCDAAVTSDKPAT